MNDKPATGTILFEVALLTIVVLMVDEWAIRGALAFIPAMLLAQRALEAGGTKASESSIPPAHPADVPVGAFVTRLVAHIRQFNATCHLAATGEIPPDVAQHRTSDLEKDLSRLLAELRGESRDVPVDRTPQDLEPLPTL